VEFVAEPITFVAQFKNMPRKIFSFTVVLLISFTSFSQSRLGDVASIYVTTADLDSSVALYGKLGFPKVNSNTFPFPWAQVSDGSVLIMMRKDTSHYMGLTYYAMNVEDKVVQLEKDGIVFAQKPKEGDPIKRYYIKTPDGFNIVMANNLGGFSQPTGMTLLNMPPADYQSADKFPNKICGAFGEFCQPVKDLNASIAYWKKLGFEVKGNMQQPYPHAILSDGLMIIGLHQTDHFTYPAISYFGLNTEKRVGELKGKGVKGFSEVQGKNNVVLNTWEGQHVFLFELGQ
jgi:hypothetical protein